MIRKPNFKLNWKYALGELVLIFLGISLAIAFQNFNEDRKMAKEEKLVLHEIKNALTQDIAYLNSATQYLMSLDSANEKILLLSNIEEIPRAVARVNGLFAFRFNTTPFELYKNSGKLELLGDQLGLQIQQLYLSYEILEQDADFFNQLVKDKLRPKTGSYLFTRNELNLMRKNQTVQLERDLNIYKALCEDLEYAQYLGTHGIASRVLRDGSGRKIQEIEKVITAIDEELKK